MNLDEDNDGSGLKIIVSSIDIFLRKRQADIDAFK